MLDACSWISRSSTEEKNVRLLTEYNDAASTLLPEKGLYVNGLDGYMVFDKMMW